MKIVCVGDCGIDHYLPHHELLVGGITANVARHARDLFDPDDRIAIVSCLGDDHAAEMVRAALLDMGIDCLWQTRRGSTPVQYIEIRADGERRFVRYDAGVLADFRFSRTQRHAIRTSDLLLAPVFDQITDLFDRLMAIRAGGRVAIDFADFLEHPDFELVERYADRFHIGFFGLAADRHAHIERLAGLARRYDKLFVITLGPAGSIAFRGDTRYTCPVEPVARVFDTTGAGDAYAAAFLASYFREDGVEAAMRHGARRAAGVVTRAGSYPG